ncbi:MAG: hypothetical protein HY784_05100 [Chloroflexi bacterium]|nr:hypothetical protein [Chloroflexota bacterium]
MTIATVEVRLALADDIVQKLRVFAKARGLTDEAVVEQALDLYFGLDDTPALADYWFSVGAMREDWEAMPDHWMVAAPEVNDALPAR